MVLEEHSGDHWGKWIWRHWCQDTEIRLFILQDHDYWKCCVILFFVLFEKFLWNKVDPSFKLTSIQAMWCDRPVDPSWHTVVATSGLKTHFGSCGWKHLKLNRYKFGFGLRQVESASVVSISHHSLNLMYDHWRRLLICSIKTMSKHQDDRQKRRHSNRESGITCTGAEWLMMVPQWGQCGNFTLNVPTIRQCQRVHQSPLHAINPLSGPLDWENGE